MKNIIVLFSLVLLLSRCREDEIITPQVIAPSETQDTSQARTAANTFYVSVKGSDTGDGSATQPWKTLRFAVTKVPANQGYTIELSSGTFVENGLIEVPTGVSIAGAGIDKTIIKAVSAFYYNPTTPSYSTDKFLISLNSSGQTAGNQRIEGFTIDGDSKKLHGGIYVHYRSNVVIDAVKVMNTNFTGMWLWDVKDSKLSNSQIVNSSWGSASYCSGALNLGNVERVEIDHLDVNESTGYGIKAIGPNGNTNILSLKIHDSRISVNPFGLWNNGQAPNIAIELWQVNLVGSEIYNSYVDNTISLVNSNNLPSTGIQTIRVHHNTLDMGARAQGNGYGIELTVNDAEVDHNYFIKGNYGITNWAKAMKNWSIHHNTFYAMGGTYPGELVRSQSSGLHNVKVYNNTLEFAGNKTMNVIGLYGGSSENIDVKNNLFIDSNTSYSYYPNSFIHLENGASLNSLTVQNNSFSKLPIGSVAGTYSNNQTSDPQLTKTGDRSSTYYMPLAGSPLINAGLNVGFPFLDSAPEIGAYEYSGTTAAITPPITTPVIPTSGTQLILDSSVATLSGSVTTGYDAGALNGNFFYVAPGLGKNYYIPPPGAAKFNFQLSKTDNYVLWAKVKSPTASNQNYLIYNGKGKWFNWAAGVHTAWTWVKVTDAGAPALFAFTQGANEFLMAWADDNVQIDQVIVTNDQAFVPQ